MPRQRVKRTKTKKSKLVVPDPLGRINGDTKVEGRLVDQLQPTKFQWTAKIEGWKEDELKLEITCVEGLDPVIGALSDNAAEPGNDPVNPGKRRDPGNIQVTLTNVPPIPAPIPVPVEYED